LDIIGLSRPIGLPLLPYTATTLALDSAFVRTLFCCIGYISIYFFHSANCVTTKYKYYRLRRDRPIIIISAMRATVIGVSLGDGEGQGARAP